MNLLLDTNAFLWWYVGDRKLGARARKAIERRRTAVSVVAALEIAIKWQRGTLALARAPHEWFADVVARSRFDVIDLRVNHALGVALLPQHHADPFDRLLIAQAHAEGLTIVTADAAFEAYDVQLLDARA